MATIAIPPEWIPVGRAYYEDKLSAAVELADTPDGGDALPATANTAIIYVTGQPLYMETDGTAATTSQPKVPIGPIVLENQRTLLTTVSFLETAASGRLDLFYFASPAG